MESAPNETTPSDPPTARQHEPVGVRPPAGGLHQPAGRARSTTGAESVIRGTSAVPGRRGARGARDQGQGGAKGRAHRLVLVRARRHRQRGGQPPAGARAGCGRGGAADADVDRRLRRAVWPDEDAQIRLEDLEKAI